MRRKKPEGEAFIEFCRQWDLGDHEVKVSLAEKYDVTYEIARHWRSDSKIPKVKQDAEVDEIQEAISEILEMRGRTQLDFACFDLETSNLKADFSILLTGSIKPYGKPVIVFRADDYSTWEKNRADDERICMDIAQELSKHAVIVSHYGTGFDVKYFRAKLVNHRLNPLPPMFGIDTYSIAKANFLVSSRRLENLCRYFKLGVKSKVEGGLWMNAAYNGSREAMDKIVQHNIQDVVLLERLAELSFPYLKSIRRL